MLYSKKYITNEKSKNKSNILKSNILKSNFVTIKYKILRIQTPSNWSCVIFKNNLNNSYIIKIYSNTYFINFFIPDFKTFIFYDINLNILNIAGNKLTNTYIIFLKDLVNLITLFKIFFFKKIKFKGKGYYLYKNKRNVVAPQFGYSHRIYIYSYFNIVKFLTKTKLIIFGLHKSDVLLNSYDLKWKRPINIFTGRGVRFASTLIYKKNW